MKGDYTEIVMPGSVYNGLASMADLDAPEKDRQIASAMLVDISPRPNVRRVRLQVLNATSCVIVNAHDYMDREFDITVSDERGPARFQVPLPPARAACSSVVHIRCAPNYLTEVAIDGTPFTSCTDRVRPEVLATYDSIAMRWLDASPAAPEDMAVDLAIVDRCRQAMAMLGLGECAYVEPRAGALRMRPLRMIQDKIYGVATFYIATIRVEA